MGLFRYKELKKRRDVEVIKALKDGDEFVRWLAARSLGKVEDSRAVEPLIEALKDSDASVRRRAAFMLGEIGDSRAVEPLIEALDDVNVFVQIKAAEALHKIGNERANEALKHKRVVERLIEALKCRDKNVREEAAEALGEIGDERAVEPLIEALRDSEEAVRICAAFALRNIGNKVISEVESLIERAKKIGINTKREEEKLNSAKLKLNEKDFSDATRLAIECKNSLNLKIRYKHAFKIPPDAMSQYKHVFRVLYREDPATGEPAEPDELDCVFCALDGLGPWPLMELLIDEIEMYREARDRIKSAESAIEIAEKFGCKIAEAKELLNRARKEFHAGNYAQAISDTSKSENIVREVRAKAKPEMEIELPLKEYKLNYWKKTSFILRNKGNAHARGVEIILPDVVSVEGLEKFDLNAGEEKELEVVLKPNEKGEVPLRVKLRYKDLKGREYESERVFLINVSDAEREESEKGRKEPSINIERGIYDPCKGGFLEGEFRRMKEWVNRHDPYAYWLVLSIQNKTGKAIEEWGVELETSSALKFEEARVEGVEYAIKVYESHPEPFRSRYAVGIPKEYGIFIPDGGSHRIYLKMRAEKPKTEYEIRGVFKYAGLEVPVRPKRFKYLCDARTDAEALRVELEKTYTKRDAARLALAFKIIQEMDRMCERRVAKTGEFLEKLSLLKDYTEGLSGKFTKQVEEFARFMKEEQFEYLDEEYKGRVKNLCTRLIDIWISEFLK